MIIRIKNLRLRCIIGFQPWEREKPQDILINARIEFDGAAAAHTDDKDDCVDYETITKSIIAEVEQSNFNLLETLCSRLLEILMHDPRVTRASVEIDKPHALRYADSVSVEASAERKP